MSGPLEFSMPDVGEGIAEAEVLQWFVEPGEPIGEDDAMVQVETDKAIVEIPAPATGTLLRQCVTAGQIAKVDELLAVIERPGDTTETSTPGAPAASAPEVAPAPGSRATPTPATRRRPMASPRVRRLAVQRGMDLDDVIGTGAHGRILESDLDAPVAKTAPITSAPARPAGSARQRADEVIELRGLRRAISRSMTEALTIPHVTEFREVDATNLLAARAALKQAFEANGIKLSVLPLLLKAVVRALALQPSMNATFDPATETLTKHAAVHLGMATATDDGLIVPVIRDADLLDLTGLATEVDRLADLARSRAATPEELSGGSFTVTNFGSFGTWLGNPVIRPPEVGIIGFGRIGEKVIAVDGQPVVRPVLPIVVATDHRINDGAHLANFVTAVADAVTQPLLLLS